MVVGVNRRGFLKAGVVGAGILVAPGIAFADSGPEVVDYEKEARTFHSALRTHIALKSQVDTLVRGINSKRGDLNELERKLREQEFEVPETTDWFLSWPRESISPERSHSRDIFERQGTKVFEVRYVSNELRDQFLAQLEPFTRQVGGQKLEYTVEAIIGKHSYERNHYRITERTGTGEEAVVRVMVDCDANAITGDDRMAMYSDCQETFTVGARTIRFHRRFSSLGDKSDDVLEDVVEDGNRTLYGMIKNLTSLIIENTAYLRGQQVRLDSVVKQLDREKEAKQQTFDDEMERYKTDKKKDFWGPSYREGAVNFQELAAKADLSQDEFDSLRAAVTTIGDYRRLLGYRGMRYASKGSTAFEFASNKHYGSPLETHRAGKVVCDELALYFCSMFTGQNGWRTDIADFYNDEGAHAVALFRTPDKRWGFTDNDFVSSTGYKSRRDALDAAMLHSGYDPKNVKLRGIKRLKPGRWMYDDAKSAQLLPLPKSK
jgi:hypothetical protein